jgi:DNA-binding NarL/FixJ family response regulator
MPRTRVLIVDDRPQVIDGLSSLIALDEASEVVGGADSGEDAVRMARELTADVVVMGFSLRGIDGIEAARRIKQDRPATEVVILSVLEPEADAPRARRAGIVKWIPKDLPPQALLDEVRAVLRARHDH